MLCLDRIRDRKNSTRGQHDGIPMSGKKCVFFKFFYQRSKRRYNERVFI